MSSDPRFDAIELTAEATDRLAELFESLSNKLDRVVETTSQTQQNVVVLKAQQDEVVREQGVQSTRLARVEREVRDIDDKVADIHLAVAGTSSLAKSALDVAVKKAAAR